MSGKEKCGTSMSKAGIQNDSLNEIVILDETNDIYDYSLANSLDDIEYAVYSKTGHITNLKNAKWKLNNVLSVSVRHIMNKHLANFSITTGITTSSKEKFIVINMHAGDLWFITGFDEINGCLYSWDTIEACNMTIDFIKKRLLS